MARHEAQNLAQTTLSPLMHRWLMVNEIQIDRRNGFLISDTAPIKNRGFITL
jgi:hypothetical protein